MFHLTSLLRRLTAVTFLVTYLSVFAGQAFCTGSADPWAKDGVASCCVGMKMQCPGMAKLAAKGKIPRQPDCNKRSAARLLASQSAPPSHAFQAPTPALLPEPLRLGSFPRFTSWQRAQKVVLVPRRHLKPKIPDIRIYIQSLTV